jgi:hypothetical protein
LSDGPRLVLANLDFEEELRSSYGAGGPARTLSAAARRAAAGAGARLGVFCRAGDRLWLPAPLDPGALPELDGLPRPVLEHGPPEALAPAAALLAWGEGPRAAALREGWGIEPPGSGDESPVALHGPLHDAVWRLPVARPEVVARVAHRGFCLGLARERGWALPGSCLVAAPGELEARLAGGGRSDQGAAGAWVVKAPFSAAGRERLVGAGPEVLRDPGVRRRLEGLFARHGSLLLEPWVERTADFGAAGFVTPKAVRLVTVHRQEVGRGGGFRGILPAGPGGAASGLAPAERDRLETAFHAAAQALRAAGYAGPFGIDAFRWRRPGGGESFHPLCEINPRLTFGLVARALAERATEPDPAAATPGGGAAARQPLAPVGGERRLDWSGGVRDRG